MLMGYKDLDELLDSLGSKTEQDKYDYEGYAVIDELKLSREELKKAVGIFWNVIMLMENNQRNKKYLFSKGLIRSKSIFLTQKQVSEEFTGQKKENFDNQSLIFREKLEAVKPAVEFLLKIKELL